MSTIVSGQTAYETAWLNRRLADELDELHERDRKWLAAFALAFAIAACMWLCYVGSTLSSVHRAIAVGQRRAHTQLGQTIVAHNGQTIVCVSDPMECGGP